MENETLHQVEIKVPPFYTFPVDVWFILLEAQFEIKKVTASTKKFYHTIAALPLDISNKVLYLIRTPPEEDAYGKIKDRLIKLYTLTD